MNSLYVLDSCAIIALLKNEFGADVVDDIIVQARTGNCTAIMNKYNLLEVYYGFYREDGKTFATQQIKTIKESPITVIDTLSDALFNEAGRLKALYKVSLADAIVLAHGVSDKATVVSSDHHEFDVIDRSENIDFLWLR
jgi:PIN domain nuclease of toxin-antitoxin system